MILHGTAEALYKELDECSVSLVWTDPPYGTGATYSLATNSYKDVDRDETLVPWMVSLAEAATHFLAPRGVVAVCLDRRSIHHVVVAMSDVLNFRDEIIWHHELGRGASKWWNNKHTTIALFDVNGTGRFNVDAVPTTARKASKVGYEGDKKVDSVWDYTLSNTASERVNYPSQKPLEIISRFIDVHTEPGDLVIDPFMGSGSTLHAAKLAGRRYAGTDTNIEAVNITRERLA